MADEPGKNAAQTSDRAPDRAPDRPDLQGPAPAGDDFKQLQRLLLGDNLEAVKDLNAETISEMLPQALRHARDRQEDLTLASVLTVESAIRTSVKQDVNVLSEALFPVIGPAARKAASAAISNLVQSFNRALEYSVSPQSFKWRVEAWQTGSSFAEVVLLRTLIYQVEQVLLIHKETGLVLQHVVGEAAIVRDPDMVSAMLTAIQDFVRDSFDTSSGEGLDSLELGDLNLWLEEGPQAVLACVIRGEAPREFREVLRNNLEKIHLFFGYKIQTFDGDPSALDDSKPYLEDCLQVRFKSQADGAMVSKRRRVLGWVLLGGIVAGLLVKLAFDYRRDRWWANYVERVDRQPGIVVLDTQRKRGRYHLEGLRDPLAADPAQILQTTRLDPDAVFMTWEPYISTATDFIEARAQALLDPPPTVTLSLDRDRQVLHLVGSASEGWIQQAERLSQQLGLAGLDNTQLVSTERELVRELQARLESQQLNFLPYRSQLLEADRVALLERSGDFLSLIEAAQRLGKTVRITLTGSGDRSTPAAQTSLGQSRAEAIRHTLVHQGIRDNLLEVRAAREGLAADPPGRAALEFTVRIQD